MFTAVLVTHILGAFVMALFALGTFVAVWQNFLPHIRRNTLFLAWGLGFELVTGSLLALLSPDAVSFVNFCKNVSLYLFATGAIFVVVYLRAGRVFSPGVVLVPVLPSVFVAMLTAITLL